MRIYEDRSALTITYLLVAVMVLGNLAVAALGALAEITAGPEHDDDVLAGIGYLFAAVWGVPAVVAAVLLAAGRFFTDQHDSRLVLAVLAFTASLAPWALLLTFVM